MKDRPDYTANILLELNCENLQLYYLRAKKDIDDFLDVFNLEVTEEINDSLLDPEGKHNDKYKYIESPITKKADEYKSDRNNQLLIQRN